MYGSMFLIGAALAASDASACSASGARAGVVLALMAGAGIGIACLAMGFTSFGVDDAYAWWRIFFVSSMRGSSRWCCA